MGLHVLFVDDMGDRLKRLLSIVGEAGATAEVEWRRTAASVTSEDIAWADVVFLDHDMCEGGEYPEPCPNVAEPAPALVPPPCECPTGRVVAEAIAEKARRLGTIATPRVVIQSVNPGGAARMAHILDDAGVRVVRAPFSSWRDFVPARLWAQMVGKER